ncbi:MAG: Gfo/Idh/MocA family oxidoreductase [Propionibacteriaceae bacterium]|nr:Gfo/Idh/MocA family oxidoreductase [Propionibacteriaceae bacterium]
MTDTTLPEPRRTEPTSVPSLRWGILGTGWIADQFVNTVQQNTSQRLVAVGSRTLERAQAFAQAHSIPQPCGSYEELVALDLDVIYVATGHLDHVAHATLALEAGRGVLVEKPMTPTLADTQELVSLARGKGLFCMEALWSMALPRFDVVRQVLASGCLGEIKAVTADMGEYLMDHHRAMDPAQGGGAMNDLGTYPLMFVDWVLPGLKVTSAVGPRHATGAVGQFMALLADDQGRQASVFASMLTDTPTMGVIAGSEATLILDGPFYRPGPVEVRFRDGRTLRWEEPRIHHEGLFHEAIEVARCLGAGLTESPLRPLDATLSTVTLMEQARQLMGDPA